VKRGDRNLYLPVSLKWTVRWRFSFKKSSWFFRPRAFLAFGQRKSSFVVPKMAWVKPKGRGNLFLR
jgi:hypothetical protein